MTVTVETVGMPFMIEILHTEGDKAFCYRIDDGPWIWVVPKESEAKP